MMNQLKDFFSVWSILRQALYYFFFMLLIWGGSNKFGKKEFHEDYNDLEVMKSLRGFAAIGVILHHISQEQAFQSRKALTPFVNAGAFFVAIFFFCSGYGLLRSLDTKENYLKGFIKNRIVKSLMLPFYVNVILYAIYQYFLVRVKWPAAQWICNFSGLTMMNAYAWFPIVLAFLYLFFYLIFRFVKVRPIAFILMAAVIIVMGIGFCYNGHFAWWHGEKGWWMDWMHPNTIWWREQKVLWFSGEWWVNSSIAFLTGLIFANYEKAIVAWFRKLYALKFHILLLLTYLAYQLSEYGQAHFGYWTEFGDGLPGISTKMKTYFCQLPVFAILGLLVILFMLKYHVSNPVTRFFGDVSLHVYLMNLMALEITRFLMDKRKFPFTITKMGSKHNLLIFAIMAFALTILLGLVEKWLTDLLKKVLFKRRKKDAEQPASV
ncbi:MAG: acyltransferase [Clostridiales bacterium]|nr:acyltransferase [Clostridiales bacterium]